ncbi:type I restriction enzyme, S subunit [Thiohalospira halophila DSM 15071]|uniref:Type I restriction enzyme, S subunit n=1 Tax=Thiohalospira halophila DSM 15071 TaxID=1123397 RepID=A0A1I1WDB2_9GAMM|nr:restriction endonuclease subunit S [Thiohalospira halophila]SFD91070.1 type I restriction enzyme, S subunit [Thiohalospira halophila DSM 15071]
MSEWAELPLEELAEISSGGTPSRTNISFWGGDIPWVTPSDITASETNYIFDTYETITEEGLASSSAKLLPAGALLLTSRATIGEIRIAARPLATNQGFKNVVPKSGTDGVFLFYQLSWLKGHFERYAAGSTFLEINRKDTGRIIVPLPKEEREQQKIARIVQTIDRAIEKTEALIDKYQQIKAGLMHDLFTRGIGPDGQLRPPREQAPELYQETPIGWLPKEWSIVRLNEIVNPARPIVYGILMPGYGHEGGVPVVKVKDINDRMVNLESLLLTSPEIDQEYQRSRLKSGDILITIRGSVGRICIVPNDLDGANITQDTARIDVSAGSNRFYSYYLESESARRHYDVNTLGVAVQGINLGEIRKLPAVKPDEDEQQKIADLLECAVSRIEAEKKNLEKLQKQKSGLMHDLLTGKLPVQAEPEDEAEAAHV